MESLLIALVIVNITICYIGISKQLNITNALLRNILIELREEDVESGEQHTI